ncbi:alpha/beta fold hydrolase [Lutispora thermophila]|uniref:Peptidase S9 prolyl oligopeptidase catalytic domain-containing protein n=1 Tax=Lutispora thermophila DSM 19022 TaxID=1122184 RepID=A0A1M6EKV7_9FIRM|nr:alpha/beta fold hydrolase [Lutispora thermophila]SHI85918.1 hypothetical protein SAMN02745176_01612 [Lutispora thermophila DSM 19022]
MKNLLDVSRIQLKNIPCIYIKPVFNMEEVPTIIYYHGWESNKDKNLFLGKILAVHGYNVIMPDAIHHGERCKLEKYGVQELRKYFWEVVLNTVKEYETLINAAVDRLGISRDRLAVMGHSMGGFIASGIFASNDEIKCLINMNGAGAWQKAEMIFKAVDYEGKGMADKKQLEEMANYDPLSRKDALYPRPILLLHGDADTSVPIDIQRYFYDEIKELYKDKAERLKFVIEPKLNHYKTLGMMEETLAWLEKYL